MVMIEMRDAAYDTAFELLDEAKHDAKNIKLTLCKLEDAVYDCYEASKEDLQDYEPEESEMDFRSMKNYRHDEHYGVREDDDRMHSDMRRSSRFGMRMRRNRMGRVA